MPAKIIAIVNQKGGTGKTTTTINLGGALASLEKKILLVDLDPQANLTYSLGINTSKGDLVNVFRGTRGLEAILEEKEDMFIAPGSTEMADVEVSLVNYSSRENFLKNSVKKVEKIFDFILIDCPPSISVLTLNAFHAASSVIIPLQMEILTLQGLVQLLVTIEEYRDVFKKSLTVDGILAVKYDIRRKLSSEILAQIKANINERVFNTVIRENVRVAEAPSFASSVLQYAPRSYGAQDYLRLAKEYVHIE